MRLICNFFPGTCRLPYWTCTLERCRWESSLSTSTGWKDHFVCICSSLCHFLGPVQMISCMICKNLQKCIHQNKNIVINLTDACPCELSSTDPVTHTALIHLCQWTHFYLDHLPLSPSPTPPPFIHFTLSFLPSLSCPTGQVADIMSSGTRWLILITKWWR